eukprot:1160894-Pelagomonas_calceolata.AAC.16
MQWIVLLFGDGSDIGVNKCTTKAATKSCIIRVWQLLKSNFSSNKYILVRQPSEPSMADSCFSYSSSCSTPTCNQALHCAVPGAWTSFFDRHRNALVCKHSAVQKRTRAHARAHTDTHIFAGLQTTQLSHKLETHHNTHAHKRQGL